MTAPLDGLLVGLAPRPSAAARVAADTLCDLGATIAGTPGRPSHVSIGDRTGLTAVTIAGAPETHVAGLPEGAVDTATGYAMALGALLAVSAGEHIDILADGVLAHLLLPEVMAASYHSAAIPRPSPPRTVGTGGAITADLTTEDADLLEILLATLPPTTDSETVATEAQQWRLPVLPYRHRSKALTRRHVAGTSDAAAAAVWDTRIATARPSRPLEGAVIVDLTTMWAGPLATWLLASLGADVHKIEPECRLDGFRAIDGMGIHPPGHSDNESGNTSGLFNALNRNKTRHDLDLRVPDHRQLTTEITADADLVIDNLSPRARSQLNVTGLIPPGRRSTILEATITAFPADHPLREWVGYGTGVHAISGLGSWSDSFHQPAVGYPDPLAGLATAVTVTATMLAARPQSTGGKLHLSLLGSLQPVRRHPQEGAVAATPSPDRGHRVLTTPSLVQTGFFQPLRDGAGIHRYPGPPWRPHRSTTAPTAAPTRNTP